MKSLRSEGYVTPKDYSSYLKFNILKGKYYRFKALFLLLFLLSLCAFLVFLALATNERLYFIIGGIILLCALMFFYTVNVNVKNICNKNAKIIRAKQRTVFGKNGFVFELLFQNESENEFDEIFYDEVDNIYLAPKAIYVYIEKRSVIVIPKRNLSVTPNEAYEFLKRYCPEKLIVCV